MRCTWTTTIHSERMQRRCANTPSTSFENTSPGILSSPSFWCCSGELLQKGHLQEQDPRLPGLKDREHTVNLPATLLSLCRFAARLITNAWHRYILLIRTKSGSPGVLVLVHCWSAIKFKNKNQSEEGQIKPFTSWVCIKQGKWFLLQPCEAFLYLGKPFLSWRNCGAQLPSCKHHRSLEKTNTRIGFVPCYTTSFTCDLSNSSASPGPHFSIHISQSLWFLHRQVRSNDPDLCHYKVPQLCFISARNLAQHFCWNSSWVLQAK